ncbi:carotenoid oxygenase family protein [Aerophototrophica crusticola]|uniref:Dioxygenase n=1 Tax=Aerophototrophica crusticola TaxID=1709002 RepID=A0A858R8W2_9PROT|nr:carotenoid oxygenase family protein [Rhodospirillaceae bacterium B3]
MADFRIGFRSLSEEVGGIDLPVQGRVPDWLEGVLLRTGPALFEVRGKPLGHWFDGLGMLYRFAFRGGRVEYRNRLLQSQGLKDARRFGRVTQDGFGTKADHGPLFNRLLGLFRGAVPSDNANVNIHRTDRGTFALTEVPGPIRIDPDTLETLGPETCRRAPPGHLTTAHPQWDGTRKEWVNTLLEFGRRSTCRVVAQAPGKPYPRTVAFVEMRAPAYMHSFGLTENFAVLFEPPFRVNPLELRLSGKPFIANYRWCQGEGTRFHMVDRRSGSVRTLEGPACFAFHQVNAFERPGEVVIDLCAYQDSGVLDGLRLDTLRGASPSLATGRVLRYRLPLDGHDAIQEVLWDGLMEMPRIHEARDNGREHAVAWGTGLSDPASGFLDCLLRLDAAKGQRTALWHQPGAYPGEPVMVPQPGGSGGVLLSLVLDAAAARSFLLVLDADTLDELARAPLPHAAPFNFHGQFYAEEKAVA